MSKEEKWPGEDEIARRILDQRQLVRYAEQFYRWDQNRYVPLNKDAVIKFVFAAIRELGFEPTDRRQRVVTTALIARCRHIEAAPAWLQDPCPNTVIACANGLVDIKTKRLRSHTENYFNLNVLPYDYEPDAPPPRELLEFLESIWGDNPDCISSFQEMLGYLLTADTSMQVIFHLCGKPRSGKGTIGRLIGALLGSDNICSPSLHTITSRFGLVTAIGKLVMLISETRFDRTAGKAAVTDILLRISGEDAIDVDRKGISHWQGKLTTRIVIQSNEALDLPDDTPALLNRLIVLPLTRSFAGREDTQLDAKLAAELGSILKWALEGYERLQVEGRRIRQPASGRLILKMTRRQSSPLSGFVEECCELDPAFEMTKEKLYDEYLWFMQAERAHPLSRTNFFSKVYTNYDVTAHKGQWVSGSHKKARHAPVLHGIRLRNPDDAEASGGQRPENNVTPLRKGAKGSKGTA